MRLTTGSGEASIAVAHIPEDVSALPVIETPRQLHQEISYLKLQEKHSFTAEELASGEAVYALPGYSLRMHLQNGVVIETASINGEVVTRITKNGHKNGYDIGFRWEGTPQERDKSYTIGVGPKEDSLIQVHGTDYSSEFAQILAYDPEVIGVRNTDSENIVNVTVQSYDELALYANSRRPQKTS